MSRRSMQRMKCWMGSVTKYFHLSTTAVPSCLVVFLPPALVPLLHCLQLQDTHQFGPENFFGMWMSQSVPNFGVKFSKLCTFIEPAPSKGNLSPWAPEDDASFYWRSPSFEELKFNCWRTWMNARNGMEVMVDERRERGRKERTGRRRNWREPEVRDKSCRITIRARIVWRLNPNLQAPFQLERRFITQSLSVSCHSLRFFLPPL